MKFSMSKLVVLVLVVAAISSADAAKKKKKKKAAPIDSRISKKCGTCKTVVKAFYKGFNDTDTIHFTGESKGWTLDNEKFLGRYKMGEARLIEILENVCPSKSHDCISFVSDYEETIEEWWAVRNDDTHDHLEDFLCVNESKACCRSGAWGSDCAACPGGAASPCNDHGTCNGAGLRTGSGKCTCNTGWSGKKCSKCKKGHFRKQSATDPPVDSCDACDASCDGCNAPGYTGCLACASGYKRSEEVGEPCEEVDECAASVSPCGERSFCENAPGTFHCKSCHLACGTPGAGSTALCSGPSMAECLGDCKDGYEAAGEVDSKGCKDINECDAGHTCGAGEFCKNTEGSVTCLACDALCSDAGCTGAGPGKCIACKDGYENKDGAVCTDVDECKTLPCQDAQTCTNNDGSFTCECKDPSTEADDDGSCQLPESLRNAIAISSAEITTRGEQFQAIKDRSRVYTGNASISSSESWAKSKKVHFPKGLFTEAPVVASLVGNGICCGDEFEFKYSSVSKDEFTILTSRTDSQSGWGQDFQVAYAVYDVSAEAVAVRTVTLTRAEDDGLGIEVVEKFGPEGEAEGIRVKKVTEGSIASESKQINIGDKILAVNGVRVAEATYEQAVGALKESGTIVLILAADDSPLQVDAAPDATQDASSRAEAPEGEAAPDRKDEL